MSVLNQPHALTVFAYECLRDRDRVDELLTRERDIYRGVLTAMATNDPKQLDRERSEVLGEMRKHPRAQDEFTSSEALRAFGNALADRIISTNVLKD